MMLKSLAIVVLVIGMMSCHSNPLPLQEKAEILVKEWGESTYPYPNSYDSITFTQVDSLFSTYSDDPAFVFISDSIELWLSKSNIHKNKAGLWSDKDEETAISYMRLSQLEIKYAERLIGLKDNFKARYKSEHIGWKIRNKYQVKDLYGVVETSNRLFYFDKEMNGITESFKE
ncbi:MAG: hypothetical protein LBQ60_21775 [Bacteroidales bacterium]|jgi:hypothetical protein|nr:hypothetical protein [Bacteroidales bacterium]